MAGDDDSTVDSDEADAAGEALDMDFFIKVTDRGVRGLSEAEKRQLAAMMGSTNDVETSAWKGWAFCLSQRLQQEEYPLAWLLKARLTYLGVETIEEKTSERCLELLIFIVHGYPGHSYDDKREEMTSKKHMRHFEEQRYPDKPAFEDKVKWKRWHSDAARDERQRAFEDLDAVDRMELHDVVIKERTRIREKMSLAARLAYFVLFRESEVLPLEKKDQLEAFIETCLEAIRPPFRDDSVMEMLVGALLPSLSDEHLDAIILVLEDGDPNDMWHHSFLRVLTAWVHVDNGHHVARVVDAFKRKTLGTKRDLRRGRQQSCHLWRPTSSAMNIVQVVCRDEMPADWLHTNERELWLKLPAEARHADSQQKYDRKHTRTDHCAACGKKKSATQKLLVCSRCRDGAFCDAQCQAAARNSGKHRKKCRAFQPERSEFRQSVLRYCASAFAVATYMVKKKIWAPFDDDSPLEDFLMCAPMTLMDLRAPEAHFIFADAIKHDAVDTSEAGDYVTWLHTASLPCLPTDDLVKPLPHFFYDARVEGPGTPSYEAKYRASMETSTHEIMTSMATTADALERKGFRKLLIPISDAATDFTAHLWADLDKHYGVKNALGPPPPTVEPLLNPAKFF